jgi:hypothetical protein
MANGCAYSNPIQSAKGTVVNMIMEPLNGGGTRYYLYVKLEDGKTIEARTDALLFHQVTFGSRVLLTGEQGVLSAIAVMP